MKNFFKKPAVLAFLAFAVTYTIALACVFWGTWSLDFVPVAPDCAPTHSLTELSDFWRGVWGGNACVPTDLTNLLGGLYAWQELRFALAAMLAALGVAFYLRGRRLSPLACYAGGGAYGLMGYSLTLFSAGHLGWFIWLCYGPFAFGLVDRAVRKGKLRNWALLGGVLAWASARQPDLWLLFTLLTFAYGVWCIVREILQGRFSRGRDCLNRVNPRLRLVQGLAVCAITTLLVGAPMYGHAIFVELGNREKQISETAGAASAAKAEDPAAKAKARDERWLFCTSWSLPPEDTLEFLIPEIHGGSCDPRINRLPGNKPYTGRLGQHGIVPEGQRGRHPVTGELLKGGDEYWMPYRQHSLYFGWLSLVFAAIGCWGWFAFRTKGAQNRRSDAGAFADVPFWMGAAVLIYLCALGGFTPFYRIIFALPFGDQIRCPVKFVHLLEFAAAVLAGFGFEFVRRRWGKGRAVVAVVLGVLAVVNCLDLARIDSKYLAPQDVTFQRAANEAAEQVVQLGGGKTFVAVKPQEGQFLIAESMGLHLVETADSLDAAGVRFVLVGGSELRTNTVLAEKMKSGAMKSIGMFSLEKKQGIRRVAEGASAQMMLLQVEGVPAPAPKEEPKPETTRQLLGILSLASSALLLIWACVSCFRARTQDRAINVSA